ncbi:MAG: cell division protein ZapB [Marinomonas sp.]
MNNELLHHLEQRINQAVDEISVLRQKIAQLEAQNTQLSEDNNELEQKVYSHQEQQNSWETSINKMLNNLNQLDDTE